MLPIRFLLHVVIDFLLHLQRLSGEQRGNIILAKKQAIAKPQNYSSAFAYNLFVLNIEM